MKLSILQKNAGRRVAGFLFLFVLGWLTLIGSVGEENDNSYCQCDCNVTFCHQYNDYSSGSDVLGENALTIVCIQGPDNATLSNRAEGKYVISGRYRIVEAGATISIGWNGEAVYESRENFTVSRAGEGDFVVNVKKKEGGIGPLYLSVTDMNGDLLFVTRVQDQDTDCPA